MMRQAAIFWLMLAIVAGVTLFFIKYEVQDREETLARLNREIFKTQESIHILNAEWSYLNQPSRLETLSRKHLGLAPMDNTQLNGYEAIPAKILVDNEKPDSIEQAATTGKLLAKPVPPMPNMRPTYAKAGAQQ